VLQPPHELEQVQKITFHLTKGWAYTRVDSSRVQSDTQKRGIDYFVYLLWTSAGMRTHRQSRVESSTVESNQTRKDAEETIWLTHESRARVRTDTIQSSPVQSKSDSPRRGICQTHNGCAQTCTSTEASRVPRVLPS